MVERPVEKMRPDDRFRLTTYLFADGAPSGDSIVTVIWHDLAALFDVCESQGNTEHDKLCGLYCDPARLPLRVTVQQTTNQITLACNERYRFELKRHRGEIRSILDSSLNENGQGNRNRKLRMEY